MNSYEILFVLAAALDDEKKEAAIETVKGIISDGGEVTSVDVWGLRRLAYPIEKEHEGY